MLGLQVIRLRFEAPEKNQMVAGPFDSIFPRLNAVLAAADSSLPKAAQ